MSLRQGVRLHERGPPNPAPKAFGASAVLVNLGGFFYFSETACETSEKRSEPDWHYQLALADNKLECVRVSR